MERSGGDNGCSLSYRFSFNLLEGDGSAGALGGITENYSGALPAPVWLIVPAALVLTAVSIPVSIRCYARRSW